MSAILAGGGGAQVAPGQYGEHREGTLAGLTGPLQHAQDAALLGPEEEHRKLDALEAAIADNLAPVHMPVEHTFTPGLYVRTITMPAGTVLTSKIHMTDHPFVIHSGVAIVRIPDAPPVRLEAGHLGVTRAGTRRALFIEKLCRWSTFHPLSPEEEEARQNGATIEELLEAIEFRIIGHRDRADGRDIHGEYREGLAACGLPGPNEGVLALEEG